MKAQRRNPFNFLPNNHQQQLGNLCNLFSCVHFFLLVDIEWKLLVSNIEKSVNFNRDFLFRAQKEKVDEVQSQKWWEQSMRNTKKASQNQMSTSHKSVSVKTENSTCNIGSLSGRYNTQAMWCQSNWWNRACVRASVWVICRSIESEMSLEMTTKQSMRACMCCWGRDHRIYYYTEYKHQHEYFFAVVIVRAFSK